MSTNAKRDEESGRPESEEEYVYKKVNYKDFVRKPKYIRVLSLPFPLSSERVELILLG